MRHLIPAIAAFAFVASAQALAEDLPVRAAFEMFAGTVEILELDRAPALAVTQDERVASGDVLAGARVSIHAREVGRTAVVFRGPGGETILHALVSVAPREDRGLRAVTVRAFSRSAGAYETRSYFVGSGPPATFCRGTNAAPGRCNDISGSILPPRAGN